MALCEKFRIETRCIEILHQEKLFLVVARRVVVALAKNFDDARIICGVLVGYDSRADHFLDLSVSFACEVKVDSWLTPVNVVFRA